MTDDKLCCLHLESGSNDLKLCGVVANDLEFLRVLKNKHKEFFFHKDEITVDQQSKWFESYQSRDWDFMFIVLQGNERIGCMGIRLLSGIWDVYNVILSNQKYKGSGLMGRAFQAMLSFAKEKNYLPIELSVLKSNPAIWWYEKNGFNIIADHLDYFTMVYVGLPEEVV